MTTPDTVEDQPKLRRVMGPGLLLLAALPLAALSAYLAGQGAGGDMGADRDPQVALLGDDGKGAGAAEHGERGRARQGEAPHRLPPSLCPFLFLCPFLGFLHSV